jgi:segregation and condensation protein A
MTDYRVNLDIYNGPLDLLLYLIRREEVDIYDIPISRITQQFLEQVEVLKAIDPNLAGDFLVMAATLMEIKTRMLLPTPTTEGEEDDGELLDPRSELVRQLLEYKAFKDAADDLFGAAREQAMRYPRQPGKIDLDDEADLENLQVWDLMKSFSRLLASIGQDRAFHEVIYDDTPVELHEADILDRLRTDGALSLSQIFQGRVSRGELVGLFLALLHLVARKQVFIRQQTAFGDVDIELNPDPPDPEAMTEYYESHYPQAAADEAIRPEQEPTPDERS